MNFIQRLAQSFLTFPGTGIRVASRFALHVAKMNDEDFKEFINSIKEIRERIKICSFCFNVFEGEETLCPICRDKRRRKDILCIVEKESDLEAIERTKKYNGLYFILGGTIPLSKKRENNIRTKELLLRIEKLQKITEIIIATNFTAEGEATGFYLERKIKELNPNLKITRLSHGMPGGGELEYADSETIEGSLLGRK